MYCTQCGEEIGEARKGTPGRQIELCRGCYKANRKENERKQDAKRRDERRSGGNLRK